MIQADALLQTLRRRWRRWALRTRPPETQPIRLQQSRVYVFPSQTGWAVLATLSAMFVAAINYNLSLGFGLVFLLGSVGIVHIFYSWRTLVGLQINLHPPGEAFAGEYAQWMISLTNDQTHPRWGLRVLDTNGRECVHNDIPAGTTVTSPLHIHCTERGPRRPGVLVLESRFPLGWIRAWSYIEPDSVAVIFPTPIGTLPIPVEFGEPTHLNTHTGPGQDDFAGLRSFTPGDSLRHIAWKQLARGQGLLTKTFASGQTKGCILDWQSLPANMPVEARLSQLSRWILDCRESGMRTTLMLPGRRQGPGHDINHHLTCLTLLALFERRHDRG